MIRIRKPDLPPQILLERGAILTAELCRKVDAGEQPSFDSFDRKVYGAPSVKQALSTAQHDKCCFCESKLGQRGVGSLAQVAGLLAQHHHEELAGLDRLDLADRRKRSTATRGSLLSR